MNSMRAALADCLRIVASPGFLARIGAILAAGAAAGLLLLVLADSLVSMPAIGARLAEARARAELGDTEGMTRAAGFEMSRFSECIGLSVAASGMPGEPAFSIRSRAVLWQPGQNICEAAFLASRRPDAVAWFDYSRYWHGYRIVVFPSSRRWACAAQAWCSARSPLPVAPPTSSPCCRMPGREPWRGSWPPWP